MAYLLEVLYHSQLDTIAGLKPGTVITQLPCDAPYFIRTQQNYLRAWYYFMNMPNQPYKFFVSPLPDGVADLVMNRQKVEYWIDGPVKCTPEIFKLSSNFIFSRDRILDTQFNQNNFFVPFVSANEGFTDSVVVGGIPHFKLLDFLARTVPITTLKDAFHDNLSQRRGELGGGHEFDFELKYSDTFLPLPIKYFAEVIRQSLVITPRVLALVDKNHLDFLSAEWEKPIKGDVKLKVQSLGSMFDLAVSDIKEISTYIEKLVYVDFLYDNPITHYFVKFKKFPYELKGSIGAKYLRETDNMLILWYYYYDRLQKQVGDAKKIALKSSNQANLTA